MMKSDLFLNIRLQSVMTWIIVSASQHKREYGNMSTLEYEVDQAAEIARDAETEAEHGGEGVEEFVVYNAKTWHSDCAEYLVSMSVEKNNRLREELRGALRNIEDINHFSTHEMKLLVTRSLAASANQIGFIVIANAIASGLTLENVGEYSDAKL
jgi:hypothetical protein